MDISRFFTEVTKRSCQNDPPGGWIPQIPENSIRLQAGYPSPDLVPWDRLATAATELLHEERDKPLQYLGSTKVRELKSWVLQRLQSRGMHVADDELLITAGSAQAIDLVSRALLDASRGVFVEAPTYMESLETFRNFTADIETVAVDAEGLCTEELARSLANRKARQKSTPTFLYTIPTNQNPTGTTMPLYRREHLLRLAEEYDFLIVEDDAYGELSFSDQPPTLKSLDDNGRVVYLGSLSKVIAPGLRIGWAAATNDMISTMFMYKKDLTHPFGEGTVGRYLSTTDWQLHIGNRKEQYKRRSRVMLDALSSSMPSCVTWFQPTGGYFVWLHVPGIESEQLLASALAKGVAFIEGRHFFCEKDEGRSYLRLSFSYASLDDIPIGVERLAEVIRAQLA